MSCTLLTTRRKHLKCALQEQKQQSKALCFLWLLLAGCGCLWHCHVLQHICAPADTDSIAMRCSYIRMKDWWWKSRLGKCYLQVFTLLHFTHPRDMTISHFYIHLRTVRIYCVGLCTRVKLYDISCIQYVVSSRFSLSR